MTKKHPANAPCNSVPSNAAGPDSAPGTKAGGRPLVLPARRPVFFVWLAGLAALYCLLLGLVVPRLAKPVIEAELSHALQSACTIGSLTVNPFTLNAVARDVTIPNPGGAAPGYFFRLRRLEARLAFSSVSRGGLALSNVVCDQPELRVSRDASGSFSLSRFDDDNSDIFPFVIQDITVRNGTVLFRDEEPGSTLAVTGIDLSLPFFSSREADRNIPLQITASATVDGDRVTLNGDILPFAPSRRMRLTLNAPKLDLARRRHLLEPHTSLVPRSGFLAADAWLEFTREGGDAFALTVGGTASLTGLILDGPQGQALALPRARAAVERLDVISRRAVITDITLEDPEVTVRRTRDGSLDWLSFARVSPGNHAGAAWAPPQGIVIHNAAITGGKLAWHDETTQPPARQTITDITFSLTERDPEDNGHAAFTAGFCGLAEGFRVTATGGLTADPPAIAADIHVDNLPVALLGRLLANASGLTPDRGVLALRGKLSAGLTPAPFLRLADGTLTVKDARLRAPTDAAAPFLSFGHLEAKAVTADTTTHRLHIGSLSGKGLALALTRAADGTIRLPEPAAVAEQPSAKTKLVWSTAIESLSLTASHLALADLTLKNARPLVLRDMTVTGKNFVTRGPAQWTATLTGKQGERGNLTLAARGSFSPPGLTFSGRVETADLRPLSPYIQAVSNISLTEGTLGGEVSGSAKLVPRSTRGGEVTLRGALGLYGITLVYESGEIGGWGRMRLEDIVCRIPAAGGRSLAIGTVAVNAPRLSVTIDQNGENSLRTALARPDVHHIPYRDAEPAALADAFTVGAITVTQGQATYRDRRLSPPYRLRVDAVTASLRDLTLDPKEKSPLTARLTIDGTPVTVEGTVSDLFQEPSGNGRIVVDGLDLARLSRYAAKYLGYPIGSGELSTDSTVSLKGRKLQMQNRIQIRNLELGEKVASPEAADLPLATAASILRDRNGVITLDLPVAGTLGDPQFRLGGVTSAVIANLVLKTVTSPVALLDSLVSGLGSLLGGADPKDARITFRPGSDSLDRAARNTLKSLSAELKRRSGFTLSITGVADAAEKDMLIDAWVYARLRAMKYNALPPARQAAIKPDKIVVSPDRDAGEYAKLLFALYRELPFIKASKDPAVTAPASTRAVMRILREKLPVTEGQLLALADARAKTVRDALTGGDKALAARVVLRQGSVLDSIGTGEHIASYVRITVGR